MNNYDTTDPEELEIMKMIEEDEKKEAESEDINEIADIIKDEHIEEDRNEEFEIAKMIEEDESKESFLGRHMTLGVLKVYSEPVEMSRFEVPYTSLSAKDRKLTVSKLSRIKRYTLKATIKPYVFIDIVDCVQVGNTWFGKLEAGYFIVVQKGDRRYVR